MNVVLFPILFCGSNILKPFCILYLKKKKKKKKPHFFVQISGLTLYFSTQHAFDMQPSLLIYAIFTDSRTKISLLTVFWPSY